jgi:phage I-like protein
MEKYVACAAGGVDVGGVPEEIRLLPLGHVHSQKGDFLVDEESFRMIEKKFLGKKVDLVIDYEHQTLKDVQAPAGGWIKGLFLGTDAIMAKVEWTARAKEYIANKEYRYLSPVIMVRKSDKRAASIHSAALTNTPAIEGMFAIANSLDIDDLEEMEEIHMDLAKVAKKLGLPETASEEDVLKALDGVLDPGAKKAEEGKEEPKPPAEDGPAEVVANSTVLGALGLGEGAKTEEVTASIMQLKAGSADDRAEILRLKGILAEKDVDELVGKALKAGKISKAQEKWAREYALKDKEGFKRFMELAPEVVPMDKLDLKDAPEGKDPDVDMAVLKACGITKEDYEKYGKAEM